VIFLGAGDRGALEFVRGVESGRVEENISFAGARSLETCGNV
jgi:hypothetical protein